MKKRWLFPAITLFFIVSTTLTLWSVFQPNDDPIQNGHFVYSGERVEPLVGEWLFYPDVFLTPDSKELEETKPEQIHVPSSWKGRVAKRPVEIGTYRLLIDVPEKTSYAVRTHHIRYANKMYMNGQLVGQAGQPSTTLDAFRPSRHMYTAHASSREGTIDLIFHVSNMATHPTGGLVDAPLFGTSPLMNQQTAKMITLDVAIVTSFLLIGFFFLVRATFNKDPVEYYFSLFAFTQGTYQMLRGERILETIIGYLSTPLLTSVQFLLIALTSYFFYRFVLMLYPNYLSQRLIRFSLALIALQLVLSFVTGWMLANHITIPYIFVQARIIVVNTFLYLQILYVLFRVYRSGQPLSLFLYSATLAFVHYLFIIAMNFVYDIPVHTYGSILLLAVVLFLALSLAERTYEEAGQLKKVTNELMIEERLRKDFLKKTAYRLTNPLLAMITLTEDLLRGKYGALTRQQQEAMLASQSQKYELLETAEELGSASNVQKRPKRSDPITYISSIPIIAQEMYMFYANVRLDVKLIYDLPDHEIAVPIEPEYFQQMLHNVLDNAMRFTSSGTIHIRVKESKHTVTITVSDTGTGMTADELTFATTPFYQGKQDHTRLGLGLPIVAQLVKETGGHVTIQSEVGRGTDVAITLPKWSGPSPIERKKTVSLHRTVDERPIHCCHVIYQSDPTFLIVGSNTMRTKQLFKLLKPMDATLVAVHSLQEALDFVSHYRTDLVITDSLLSDTTGSQLIMSLREQFDLIELPIFIMTSGYHIPSIVLQQWQVNDSFAYPLDGEHIIIQLQRVLEMKQTARKSAHRELNYYVAQISPHFLYNTMNTIIGLSYEKPELVTDALFHLTTYFRAKLSYFSSEALVPLDDEMELIEAYVAIEQLRFDERVRVTIEDEALQPVSVPPLALQTIVENSINHGLLRKEEGGHLLIRTEDTERYVRIIVQDDGVGMDTETIDTIERQARTGQAGIGLANTIERLELIRGASIQIESTVGVGTRITITLPVQSNAYHSISYFS